jgi:hypothetical protein
MPPDIQNIDWETRERIFDQAVDYRGSVNYTFERNYFGAKLVGWIGWILEGFTAILGGVLIFVLRGEGFPDAPTYLAVGILVSALISSFYGPKLRSRDYYQAGQEHQELYDEFDEFIHLDIPDSSQSNPELRDKLESLNTRRHQLNQSTPQLGGIWYYTMKFVGKIKWGWGKVMPWKEVEEWYPEGYREVIPKEAAKQLSD